MISKQTAMDIAYAHREVEVAETLLADVEAHIAKITSEQKDIRDVFGRRVNGLELGVPTSDTGRRLFTVPWPMAAPIIRAHIAAQREKIALLTELAVIEARAPRGASRSTGMP